MPTYEFACSACGAEFDEVRPIDHRNDPALCKCGALAVREIRTPAMGQPDIRPYRAMAGDRAGKLITSRREHRDFLRRNHLHEAADVKMPEGPRPMRPITVTADYKAQRKADIRRALRQHVPRAVLQRSR
jgi:putative FmdB family regulatory protein